MPFRGFKVDDEDIIEDLALEANSPDSSKDHDFVSDLGSTVVRTWIRSSDLAFGVLGYSTRFLVGGLFPLPGVTEFEEIRVVEALVG